MTQPVATNNAMKQPPPMPTGAMAPLPPNPMVGPPVPPNMPMPPPPNPMMPPGAAMPFPMPGMPFPMYPGMKAAKGKGPQPMDKWRNVSPNNTVYVNNLNEKTSRDEIVNGLREVFGQFGKVLDVICYTKIKKCKGQAWVVMEKTEAASRAITELQNFFFFNKPMRVAYSLNVSDATLKRDGKPLPQRERPPKKKKQKRKMPVEESPKKKKKRKKSKTKRDDQDEEEMKEADGANNHNTKEKYHDAANKNGKTRVIPRRSNAPPNKTLFLQNLPEDASEEEIQNLFMNFPGFLNVNLIENKPGIGFAEFNDTYNSSNAANSLNGYAVRGHDIMVEFAQ